MRRKASDRPKWLRSISTAIEYISDLKELRQHLSEGASLVAFDTESYSHLKNGRTCSSNEVSELGFAAVEWPRPDLKLCISSKDFALQNNAKLLNIQLRQRTCLHVESTSSPIVHVNGTKEAEEAIRRFLPESSKRILVGYALSTEFKWIAMHCPGLAKSFAAWVDVQELVMQHYGKLALVPVDITLDNFSLRFTLHAMNFTRSPNDSRAHRAVNDACRFLQNLAGLLTSHPFTITPSSGPLLHLQPILRDKKRFSITLCITASNGYLPRKPPFEIARIYQKFEPIAVGTYRHRGNGDSPSVPYWWLALRDQESLMKCKAAVDGSVVDGVVLKAVMGDEYVWEWLRPQVRQKRLETRLEKVEAFEMADLFDQLC